MNSRQLSYPFKMIHAEHPRICGGRFRLPDEHLYICTSIQMTKADDFECGDSMKRSVHEMREM
jgi:hypothetical protein